MLAQVQTHLASKLLCKKQPKAVVCHVLLLGEQLKQIVLLQVSREVRKTWRIMINDWQNMSGYRPRKKNPKTENHPKNKKQQAEEMHFYFSSYYKWIPEKRKQQQKLLWLMLLWIRWKMQFCFGRCCSTVIHQKGTFVGKSSSLLSLIFSLLWLMHSIWKLSKKVSLKCSTCTFTQKSFYVICEIWKWSNCAAQEVPDCD